jgi:hypothetical protein
MSAEGESFDVLKNTLDKVFFPEYEIRPYNVIVNQRRDGIEFDYKKHGSPVCPEWLCCKSVNNPRGKCRCIDWSGWEDMDRLLHFYYVHKKLKAEGSDFPLNKECLNILRKYRKREKDFKLKGLTFYTICPKDRLPFNDDQINKLRMFCEKRFTAKNFERCKWVIESGKHEENPNLHIHCIGRLRNKNFKREFITQWNKIYDNEYNISYNENDNRGWDMIPCNTAEIQEDKLNYLKNSLKGNHENFIDLKIGGTFGFGEGGDSTTAH